MHNKVVKSWALVMMVALIMCWSTKSWAAFQANGDGTVTDTVTGLMWQQGDAQNDSGGRTWE